MNQSDYCDTIAGTWNPDSGPAVAMLGLCGELGEYLLDSPEEIGDVLYYLTTLRRLLGLLPVTHPDTVPPATLSPSPAFVALELSEAVKKHVAHDTDRLEVIDELTVEFHRYLHDQCMERGWGVQEIREGNAEKVTARFPDGFDVERTEVGKGADQ